MSQTVLGAVIGVDQTAISQVEKGKRSGFEADNVFTLERALGVKRGELVKHLPPEHPAHLMVKLSEKVERAASASGRHKVIGVVNAGRGIDEQDGSEWVDLPEECDGADGVYLVKGKSMLGAGILPFDRLVVRQTDTPADGDLVVAWTSDFGAVVKRVSVRFPEYARSNGYTLLTEGEDTDNRYPYIMRPDNGDRIYAVVIAVFRTYKAKPASELKAKAPAKRKPS